MSAPVRQAAAEPARPEQPAQHGWERCRAPLLRELDERLGRGRRVMLDLGPATTGTIEFLQGSRCRLLVADAADALHALASESDEAALARQMSALLPADVREPIDAVLCWNLLDYLSLPLLAALGARLAQIARPGALVHAIVRAGEAGLPERPARFAAAGAGHVDYELLSASQRRAPRYSPWDLERHGRHFRVDRSVMLANGMQEYLLRIESGAGSPREVKPVYRTGG